MRSEVQPSRRCMSHSMHPQCCNEVFHLVGTFSGNPSLAVFSNSMGSKRLFHWRKLQLFWASFSPQKCNEISNLQIKSSLCFHAPRSGISRRSWDFPCRMHLGRTRTSQDFYVKNASLIFPETNSLPLEMKGWKMKFIEISFWDARPMLRVYVSFREWKTSKLFNLIIWSRYSKFSTTDFPFQS